MSAKIAQMRLNAAGYDVGPADGIVGARFLDGIDAVIADAKRAAGGKVLKPSPRIIDFIKGYEKLRLTAYLPTPNDRPTIGWGSTGPDIRLGMTWNIAEADKRFADDLKDFSEAVRKAIGDAPTTQAQFDAMVSLAYNIGIDGFRDSTLRRKHIARDYVGAAEQFARWNKQAGVVLNGLTRRRAGEAAIYREAL